MRRPDWQPVHRLALFGVSTLGWVVGTLAMWLRSPLYRQCQAHLPAWSPDCRRALYGWIPKFSLYWPWPVLGAIVFGATYLVLMRIWRGGRQLPGRS
jgi:hypothetical protein